MLEVRDLTIYRGDKCVLKDISFSLGHMESLAVCGESGCGKSSLLLSLCGFITSEGSIKLKDQEIKNLSPEKRGIGIVFQDLALFPQMSVFENILYGLKGSESVNRALEMLKLLNITPLKDKFPHQISGGQKQRVALARSLAPSPDLILFDEPFSSLDPVLRREVRGEIKEILTKEKVSSILVTHDADDALAFSERVAILRDREIEQLDEPFNLMMRPASIWVHEFFQAGLVFNKKEANKLTENGASLHQISEDCFYIPKREMTLSKSNSMGISALIKKKTMTAFGFEYDVDLESSSLKSILSSQEFSIDEKVSLVRV